MQVETLLGGPRGDRTKASNAGCSIAQGGYICTIYRRPLDPPSSVRVYSSQVTTNTKGVSPIRIVDEFIGDSRAYEG